MQKRNILGHDSDSELKTIIARLRENKFTIISRIGKTIIFEINLKFYYTVPISNTYTQNIEFKISLNRNCYELEQVNGSGKRIIPFNDGYIIWNLLSE